MKFKNFLVVVVSLLVICGMSASPAHSQNCPTPITTNFASYDSATVSQASETTAHIITSVSFQGSAYMDTSGWTDPGCFQQTASHTPYVGNVIAGQGYISAEPQTCPSCYISVQSNQDSGLVNVGQDYTWNESGSVQCSIVGELWSFSAMFTLSIRLSAYIFNGLSGGLCTWVPTCAGKCSSQHTTNTLGGVCFTDGPYKQCFDLLKNGVCWSYRVFCYGKAAPGICSN